MLTALGKTNLIVTRMGCGLIRIGRKWGVNTPQEPELPDRHAVFAFLRGAVELGINFFDTAPSYGTSEELLGKFIKAHPGLAQQMIIATKCGEHIDPDGNFYKDFSTAALQRSIETSLQRLGGFIHLLQLHSINSEILESEETLRVLEDFQSQGSVGHLGVTCSAPPQAVEKALSLNMFATIQVPYNPTYPAMTQVMELAKNKGVGVIANRPLAAGLLSSKSKHVKDPKLQKLLQKVRKQAGKQDLTSYAWDFVLQNSSVSVVLTGTRNLTHLRQNLSFLA